MTEEIDAVYTWVDGSDPEFQAAVRRYTSASTEKQESNRFRNNGEFRYSLRSVFRFAPWIRRIHILTNGQVPSWLDCSHPRIHLVTHAEVFPEPGCLPTFNSNAIEMCLHRIPGLSRRFIYFNDDVFLGRSVQPGDFFLDSGGQKIFLHNSWLPSNTAHGSAHDRACAHTQNVLTKLWGPPATPRRIPAHTPQVYDRNLLFRLESLLQDEFRRTESHRFRSGDDLVLSALYGYSLNEAVKEKGRHELLPLLGLSHDYSFMMLEHKFAWAMRCYLDILLRRPRFFCINDDLGDISPHHPLLLSLRTFLHLYFPQHSAAERTSGWRPENLQRARENRV